VAKGEAGLNFNIDAPDFPQAKCAELDDKDFFFPKSGKQEAERLPQLRTICATCIHEKECLEYATEKQIDFGFWGGKSANERNDMRAPRVRGFAQKGRAKKIKGLLEQGKSVSEISTLTGIRKHYVNRIFGVLRGGATKGATPLHEQTKNLYEGSQPS
jgi:hypothetical protein